MPRGRATAYLDFIIPAAIAHDLGVLRFALVLPEVPVEVLFVLGLLLGAEAGGARRALQAHVHALDDAAVLGLHLAGVEVAEERQRLVVVDLHLARGVVCLL